MRQLRNISISFLRFVLMTLPWLLGNVCDRVGHRAKQLFRYLDEKLPAWKYSDAELDALLQESMDASFARGKLRRREGAAHDLDLDQAAPERRQN